MATPNPDAMKKSLLDLPDDALLAVLTRLPCRELFNCRTVCRRLRDLCLHPRLWAAVRRVRGKGLVRAVLRLAPCLGAELSSNVGIEALAAMVAETSCAMEKLSIYVHDPVHVALATAIIEKASSLGGLRELTVWCFSATTSEALQPLLSAILRAKDLRVLYFWNCGNAPMSAAHSNQEGESSLTELSYQSATLDPFFEVLLKTHAASLEKVCLQEMEDLPLALLNAMPKLRSLACKANDALPQLRAISTLENVTLQVKVGQAFSSGSLDFLRKASQLREVTLYSRDMSPAAPLQALAASCSARLVKRLTLWGLPVFLDLLVPVLPHLPSLQALRVAGTPSDDFLRAVAPVSAPCLTELGVRCPQHQCPHAYVHDPAIQDVLRRNSALHVYLDWSQSVEQHCECEWCEWGCHLELVLERRVSVFAFSAHRRRAGCPWECYQVAVTPCPDCDCPAA